MTAMRRLVATLSLFGLAVGLGCAVVVHFLPVGQVGWFAYTPLASAYRSGLSLSLNLPWWPSVVVLPAVGLAVGALFGVVLARIGWRIARSGCG